MKRKIDELFSPGINLENSVADVKISQTETSPLTALTRASASRSSGLSYKTMKNSAIHDIPFCWVKLQK